MKLVLLAAAVLALASDPAWAADRRPAAPDSALRVMTFNIRYDTANDGADAWPHRKDLVASMVRLHGADLVGLQEALRHQIGDLLERLPGFAYVGVGRTDGREAGEYSAILYHTGRFERLDDGTFWLSETPEVPGKGWDAAFERVVTWAKFRDRETGAVFFHFNTHLDHVGVQARAESARMIRQRIAALAGDAPVVLTGDFNTTDETEPYAILTGGEAGLQDAMRVSEHPHHGPTSTWNGFEAIAPDQRIDFVFVGGGVRVRQHAILADTWDGRFPSDHLPVLAELVLP